MVGVDIGTALQLLTAVSHMMYLLLHYLQYHENLAWRAVGILKGKFNLRHSYTMYKFEYHIGLWYGIRYFLWRISSCTSFMNSHSVHSVDLSPPSMSSLRMAIPLVLYTKIKLALVSFCF